MNGSEESAPDDEDLPADAEPAETDEEWRRFARKGAERREFDPLVQLLVQNARDLVFRFRVQPKPAFEYVSPAARAMTGYDSREFYSNPGLFLKIVHPEDRGRFEAYLRGEARTDVPLRVRWIRKDGAQLWVEARFVPVRDAKEDLVALEAVVRNVSDRQLAEQAYEQVSQQGRKRREAERHVEEAKRYKQLQEMKLRFVTMAAKELGNPITPIQLQLHLLKTLPNENLSADQRHAIKILDRNVDRLARLIHDVLDAAKHQVGHLSVTRQPVDLDLLVEEAVAHVEEAARKKEVGIEVLASAGAPVSADPARVEEVLYNLLANAIGFVERRGRITVTTGQDGRKAYVRVGHTGRGLSHDEIRRLFEPFSRRRDKDDVETLGSGLGLYVSRLVVEMHGGKIWAHPAGPTGGTTFELTLPVAAEGDAKPLRVLLVEQDETDSRNTRESLDRMPVPKEVLLVRDESEALDWLQETEAHPERGDRPDLLVVDLDLPGGGGDRVLREIRSDVSLHDLPVIAISSSDDDRRRLQTYQLDASGFLTKPVAVDELRMLLRSLRLV